MAMLSSGVRNLGKLIGSWALALGLTAVVLTHFNEIRTALGLKLSPRDFGVASEGPVARTVMEFDEKTLTRDPANRDREPQVDQRRRSRRAREDELFTQKVALRRDRDGHFRADAEINGRRVDVLVDTGATLVAMSYEDAASAGISVGSNDFRYVSQTANGQARFARVTLDQVRIGNVIVRNVPAAVSEPGRLGVTLLGMSFLGQLRMEMRDGMLVLEQ